MTLFKNASRQICQTSFSELTNMNSKNEAHINEHFLGSLCLRSVYLARLLKLFGIENFDNVQINNTVNGYNIGWTLGYLINELNRDDFLPFEEPPRKLPFKFYFPLLFLCCLVLICVFICELHLLRKRRSEGKSFWCTF